VPGLCIPPNAGRGDSALLADRLLPICVEIQRIADAALLTASNLLADTIRASPAWINRPQRVEQPAEVHATEELEPQRAVHTAATASQAWREADAEYTNHLMSCLAVPGVVDQSELATASDGVAKVVLEAVQEMLLKLALQMERDDYEARRERQARGIALAKERGAYAGRKFDKDKHERILSLRAAGNSIAETFRLAKCSTSLVKLVCAGAKS
jgi:hypothetical protein